MELSCSKGDCPVEDAEPLLQLLQATPDGAVGLDADALTCIRPSCRSSWRPADAVGPCGDAWVEQWVGILAIVKLAYQRRRCHRLRTVFTEVCIPL